MTPQMQEALYRVSLCYDPDPDVVFRSVAQAVSDHYGGTMAMINLADGDRQVFHTVINPFPCLEGVTSLPLEDTH